MRAAACVTPRCACYDAATDEMRRLMLMLMLPRHMMPLITAARHAMLLSRLLPADVAQMRAMQPPPLDAAVCC